MYSVIDTYGDDLTKKTYITNPAIAREEEIKRAIVILLTPEKSALLVGKPGIGKTAIVEGIAYLIQKNEVPDALKGYRIVRLNSTSLLGTMTVEGREVLVANQLVQELKTTDKTYEAASYLIKLGADNILKQELLQENKDNYVKRQKLIEKSFMINKNMTLCILDNKVYENKDLAAIAEELLQFENVEASFVIGKIKSNIIGISARSIGKINVEEIMAKLGGGGHYTEAATQIKDKTIVEVQKMLLDTIKEEQ